ncbi:MAG: Urease accessory protein UreD [Bryobacterales bacterium]|nr:Urease accessory protein UreD [Bryobacterales bacterium]
MKRQDPPWKVVRAFALPVSGSLVHLNNVSGGVLAGDRLALDVEVEAGAAAQITTTGATRLYRHRAGAADSEQHARFSVGDAALLEYLPDAVIPYMGSRHVQRTEIRLGRGSTLFWWEVLAPGRLAAGERFAFERLRVQTEVYAGPRPVLREDYLLEPKRKALSATARMFKYSHMASLCAVQEGRPPAFWRTLEDRLNEIARRRTHAGQALWGASMLASDGVVVRGLSMSGCFIPETLIEFWSAARLAITGKDGVPPRKIY